MLGRLFDLLSNDDDDLERKVNINKHLCLNLRSGRTLCRACEDVCPARALSFDDLSITSKDCLACGLCAVACPTGVLDELWTAASKVSAVIKDPRPDLWVTCQKAESVPDALRVNCLGELTTELVLLMLYRGVRSISILYNPALCQECNLSTGQQNWEKVQNQLIAIYPPEEQRVFIYEHLAHKQTSRRPVDYSRRSLLRSFSSEAKQMAVNALLGTKPSLEQPKFEQGLSLRRKILISVLSQLDSEQQALLESGYLNHPQINEDCTWCGSCSTLCPSGALKLEALEDDKIGLVVSPSICNMCGLCAAVCPAKAVTVEWSVENDSPPQQQVLCKGELRNCEGCHHVFWATVGHGTNLCPECSYRTSKPRITWPELTI
jgi:ferredoxin